MAAELQQRSLVHLPSEIISHILKCNALFEADICRVAQVCKNLHDACYSNDIWKAKFFQRWPSLLKELPGSQPVGDWYELYKLHFVLSSQVRQLVSSLAEDYYHKEDISNEGFDGFYKLFDLFPQASMFVLDELRSILCGGDRNAQLTERYYAEKAFQHLQHASLRNEIRQFLNLPAESQQLEIGAMMVSRWFQPGLDVSTVWKQLDTIANKVREELRQMLPDLHPACEHRCSTAGLTESVWTPAQCRQVLEAIGVVLYRRMGFTPNETTYYSPENSYLDRVLEKRTGIPITLCILYSSIAHRLGVVCEPVNFPAHFLLRWKEHPMAITERQYTYIDAYGCGRMMSQEDCPKMLDHPNREAVIAPESYAGTTPAKVLERMARNLVTIARHPNHSTDGLQMLRSAIDLYLTTSPDDTEMRLMQVRIFLHLNINLKDAIESLQQVAAGDMSRIGLVGYLTKEIYTLMKENEMRDSERNMVQQKLRKDNPEVYFSVGMVMKHKKYHYICVIYGWDKECRASEEWITQMGVGSLPGKQFQPFYNVLVEDGSNRYAAQENLLFTKEVKVISHPDVGRYFETFTGKFYVPNKMKRREYPDDADMTCRLVGQHFSSMD